MNSPSGNNPPALEIQKHKVDVAIQFYKLLIGLDSGSIVLMSTFLRDLFPQPVVKPLLLTALVLFSISLFFCVLLMSNMTEIIIALKPSRFAAWLGQRKWPSYVAEYSFFLAVVLLTAFAIYNLSLPRPLGKISSPATVAEVERGYRSIDELHRVTVAARKTHDPHVLSSTWTDDVVLLAPGRPAAIGREAAFNFFSSDPMGKKELQVGGYSESWAEVLVLGDYAFEWGIISNTAGGGRTGEVLRRTGKGLES